MRKDLYLQLLVPEAFTFHKDRGYEAKIDLPGIPPDKIDLRYHENGQYLTIGANIWTTLPPDADPTMLNAEYYHGRLVVRCPMSAGTPIAVRVKTDEKMA